MEPRDDSEPVPETPSLAERLKRRFGSGIDPRIDLPEAAAPAATELDSKARSWPSSSVIRRMGERGVASSRYRMEGEIARGGMGAILEVYDEDLRRKLAMKVILDEARGSSTSSGRATHPQKLARFLEEAQVTGQLDHPGIVPVHELGLDAHGQVYFTMRLVRGRDLAAIFRLVETHSEGWTTTRALGVLLKVCEAMAFAHTKGVVHRDLKPANVMVGQFGEVYVMDWGLARVRDHADRHDLRLRPDADEAHAPVELDPREASADAGGDDLYTMDGDVLGTPSYMSPEQARGELEKLDAKSDVYALGAMLYRLLAGTAPHTSRHENVGARAILERVWAGPPAPIAVLAPEAPAELVAIAEKAMEREPAQRYPDMLAVAEDLRAFLEGRVVGAFETGAFAEARKWVRRNKRFAASLAAAVVALAGGLAASIVFARAATASAKLAEERRAESDANAQLAETRRKEADENAAAAERQARIAAEVNRFLNKDLLAAVAPEEQGIDVSVREVLEQASTRLEGRFADEPMIEAALRGTIGTAFERLGEYEPARMHLERALELARAHDGERADSTIEAELSVATVWSELGRFDESIAMFEEAAGAAAEVHGAEDPRTLTAQSSWATTLVRAGRMDEARSLFVSTIAAQTRVLGSDHADTLTTRSNLAILELDQGHFDAARRELTETLERRRATVGPRHPETLNALSLLANAEADAGDFTAAVAHSRESVALRREVFGLDHPLVGQDMGNLAVYLFRLGRSDEAIEMQREAVRIAREKRGEDHPITLKALGNLATELSRTDRKEESLALQLSVLERRRRIQGAKHADTLEAMNSAATTYLLLKRLEEAEPLYRETLALQREVLGADHPATIITLENLSNVLFQRGDAKECKLLLLEVLAARKRVLGDAHPDVAKTTFNLAMVTQASGDTNGALALLEEALARGRAAGPDGNQAAVMCLQKIGEVRSQAKEHDAAIEAFTEALAINRTLREEDPLNGYFLQQIGTSQAAKKDYTGALASFQETLELRERLLGPDHDGTRATLYMLAKTLVALKRFADAEPLALDFHERTLRTVGPNDDQAPRARKLLADLYDGWLKPDEAAQWR